MNLKTFTLYHAPLDAGSRFVRLLLAEKGLDFTLCFEKYWDKRNAFLFLNPAGEIPVLTQGEHSVCGAWVIGEHLEDIVPTSSLYGSTPQQRAESRRLLDWFLRRFQGEVMRCLADEYIIKRILGKGPPDPAIVRLGRSNLRVHLKYIEHLIGERGCLNTSVPTAPDFAAAASISCLDYLGEVPWKDYPQARDWYARIKSRPSFKSILMDNIPSIRPSAQYTNLDF